MQTKSELAQRIWEEFVLMQHDRVHASGAYAGLPGMIPSNDGKSLVISDQMATDIHAFTRLVHDADAALKIAFGSKDIADIVRRAFGATLGSSDLDASPDAALAYLLDGVEAFLREELGHPKRPQTFVFGCWLIRDEVVQEIAFGPVRFERRELWLNRAHREGHISDLIFNRVQQQWAGRKLRPLKNHMNRWREEGILKAVAECPMICTVITNGLATEAAREKALLAARLAMTAIALIWERPSYALDGFGLLMDGGLLRQTYLTFGEPGAMSVANDTARRVGRTWVIPEEWPGLWEESRWLVGPTVEVLASLLDTSQAAARPKLVMSLLHAFWWLYEACRAEAPLMAAAKFGACLDILAGGTSEGKILHLIKARLGAGPDDSITPDKRSARSVVKMIYGAARSRTIHGSNDRYDHDWRGTRDLAEHLTRICFVEVLVWLGENPDAVDLSGAVKA